MPPSATQVSQPGFLLEDLCDQNFKDKLFQWLSLNEVSGLECVSTRCRDALRLVALWERLACRELQKRFRMPHTATSTAEARKAVRAAVTNLRGVHVPRDCRPVNLANFAAVQELARWGARARRDAARHRAEHGQLAEIIVANFRFGKGASLDGEALHVSSSIVTSLNPGKVRQVWEFKLALQSGAVLLGSRRRSIAGQQSRGPESGQGGGPIGWRQIGEELAFLADLHCVNSAFVLHLYDMHVHPMSGWVRGHGLVSVRDNSKVDPATALREGLLCVLCLRGVPSMQGQIHGGMLPQFDAEAMARPYRSLNAMNLDVPYQFAA